MMKQKNKHDSKGTTSTNVQRVVKNKTTVAIVLLHMLLEMGVTLVALQKKHGCCEVCGIGRSSPYRLVVVLHIEW